MPAETSPGSGTRILERGVWGPGGLPLPPPLSADGRALNIHGHPVPHPSGQQSQPQLALLVKAPPSSHPLPEPVQGLIPFHPKRLVHADGQSRRAEQWAGGCQHPCCSPSSPPAPICLEAHFLPSPALQLVLKPPLRNVRQGASRGAGDPEMRSGGMSMVGSRGQRWRLWEQPPSPCSGLRDSRAGSDAQRDP